MKFNSLVFLYCIVFLPSTLMSAQDEGNLIETLSKKADFNVRVVGNHVDKFDFGLFELDAQSQPTKPIRVRREGCFDFFLKQKNKGMILVRYYATPIENWSLEVERTVKYFKDAGFNRVVLIETFNMTSKVSIKHDTDQAKQSDLNGGK